jgi:putative pyruvate formate lyase activating enzyme
MAEASPNWEQISALYTRLAVCDLCPHRCGVNRLTGELGRCRVGALARVASACDHHGEEPVLSGTRGSGTVFFAGCNLRCVYCQNHQISQGDLSAYPEQDTEVLATTYLRLQTMGCHNLNLVSPTHVTAQAFAALALAQTKGFHLPVVYNTNGYDAVDVLQLLDGAVQVYLPDLKYADATVAMRYSVAPDYPEVALAAIREMYRQVGPLKLDADGLAVRGVIVRHLVLPNNLAGTRIALRRLVEEVSPEVTVSLMAQYYPTHQALQCPELSRTITAAEYDEALDAFTEAGLENGWAQEPHEAPESYRPDFHEEHPFERE